MRSPEIMRSPEQPEQKEMEPIEVLRYMAQMGRDLEKYAIRAQAMIEEAKERGIPVDLSGNQALKKFAPLGEYEVMLITLRSEMMGVGSDLYSQGVKMTKEDLDARLKKMEQSK